MDINIEYLRQQLQIAADAIENCQNELPPPTHVVQPGDDIQSVIDSVEPGDIIEFIQGKRYVTGSLTFANKPITLRCQGSLPDRRIAPTDNLPILASGGHFSTINGTDATNLVISGLSFESRDDGGGDVIVLDNARDILLDRIIILGGPNGQKRGIRANGERITLQHSYIANIWAFQQDSQAYCAWNSLGHHTILNCYLEAAGENVLFGGADNVDANHIPNNILIQDCTLTKRDEWRLKKNFYSVKNLFELKMARYVTVHNCIFEKNWTDAQAGWGIVLKSANQDGGNPWAVTEHVLFEDCILADTDNGINIQGKTDAGQTSDIVFRNCRIETKGVGIQIGGAGEITVEQCTFHNGYTYMSLYGNKTTKLTHNNTLGNHNQYGIKGDGTAVGQPSLTKFINELIWNQNALLNPTEPHPYPPTTYFRLEDIPPDVNIGASI